MIIRMVFQKKDVYTLRTIALQKKTIFDLEYHILVCDYTTYLLFHYGYSILFTQNPFI